MLVGDAVKALAPSKTEDTSDSTVLDSQFLEQQKEQVDQTGQLISDTRRCRWCTQSSMEKVLTEQLEQVEAQVADVANRLTEGVLGPVLQSAVTSALVVSDAIEASTKAITTSQDKTTTAVKSISI